VEQKFGSTSTFKKWSKNLAPPFLKVDKVDKVENKIDYDLNISYVFKP